MKSAYSAVRTVSLNKQTALFIEEQTVTFDTYIINSLVFITEKKSVYRAVRIGSLNKTITVTFLKG